MAASTAPTAGPPAAQNSKTRISARGESRPVRVSVLFSNRPGAAVND